MTNPTTPFNWQMPTSTDLVTDLPADFEVFGQAVATSMADLLGGTTGQVLAKQSNTNMDFQWVTTDDANAIQNAIVDAKGDLIAATANDTPARLAVGANDTMLVADSTAATGLAYKSATTLYPWTAYTSSPGNLTVGNGTLVARYQQIGKLVNIEIQFTFGSTSSISGSPTFALPVNAKMTTYSTMGSVALGDFGVGNYVGLAATPFGNYIYLSAINTTGATAIENAGVSATFPFVWTTNDFITIRATYEAA